jgi:hypothetical protein
LLYDVCQFMGQQPSSSRRIGLIFSRGERHVPTNRKGTRIQRTRCPIGACIPMDPDVAEIDAKARFHGSPNSTFQGLASAARRVAN